MLAARIAAITSRLIFFDLLFTVVSPAWLRLATRTCRLCSRTGALIVPPRDRDIARRFEHQPQTGPSRVRPQADPDLRYHFGHPTRGDLNLSTLVADEGCAVAGVDLQHCYPVLGDVHYVADLHAKDESHDVLHVDDAG